MARSLKVEVVLEIVKRNLEEMEIFFNDIKTNIDMIEEDKVDISKVNCYLETIEKLSVLMIQVRKEGEKLCKN